MSRFAESRRSIAAVGGVALIAAIAAAGCLGPGRTPRVVYITPTPGSEPTLAPGATPTPAPASPTISSVVISSDAPDGRWKVIFKKPVVSGVADPAGTAINDAITTQINQYIANFTGSGLPAVANGAGPSTLEGDFSTALDSPSVLSLRFTMLAYVSGSAHPAGTPGSLTFVVATGKPVALADLFTDANAAVAILAPKSHDSLSSQLSNDLTWSGSAPSLDFFSKAWVFTPAGLEFSWPQGDLASMAAGMPSAVVSWGDLKSVVKQDSPAYQFAH
jgi:hypothetical protein